MAIPIGINGSASQSVAFIAPLSHFIFVRGRMTNIYRFHTARKLTTPPISPPINVIPLRLKSFPSITS